MSDGAHGLAVFLTAGVIVSLWAHLKFKRFGIATLVSTVVPPVILIAVQFPKHGHSESWVPLALLFSSVYALGLSLLIGVAIGIIRKLRATKSTAL